MPRKWLNHPNTLCYMCGQLTFKYQRQNFTPHITKCYDLYFGCKAVDQDKIWFPHICCVKCVRPLQDGYMIHTRCHLTSPGLEGTRIPLFWFLCLFNKCNRDHLQIQTHSEISRSAIGIEACPHSEELLVPKPPKNLTCNDDNSDYDENHRQQEGDNVHCKLTFEASCSSSEPRLLTPCLNDFVRGLNLSKTSWTLRFWPKI
jgi:hypothetical protein